MTVRVLGTLDLDGVPISPRERAFLAALVLRAGSTVAPDELADAVWGEQPPATWAKQVQIAIARLRRHPGSPRIATSPDGYRVEIPDDGVDAAEFEQLVAAGLRHMGSGAPDRAEAALVKALALWRGSAYPELADWPPGAAESHRLDELREFAQEELLSSRLALGRSSELVGDAELLVRNSPLRERRWELLATTLYRSGRQADALAAIREARRRFDEDLGIELSDRLSELEGAILRHDAALAAPVRGLSVDADCPYRGLDAFDADDEREFFGRDREVAAGLTRLEHSRFVAFVGPSGCGKSSLIRAGIVPALRRRSHRVDVLLPRRSITAALSDRLGRQGSCDVLVIDQFEELLHLGLRPDEIEAFGRGIARFIDAGGTVIATVRSDHLDDCAALPHLAGLFAGGVQLVPPMGAEQLREAIEGPAAAAGLRLEAGLAELILRDAAGRPGVLPLVSHALVETWLRRDGATLTVAGYEDAGGLSGAIAQSADLMYRRMSPEEREVCRATMLRLVALGSDGTPVRRSLPTSVLHEDETRERVLARLSDARLVSADESVVVVAHEALADAWPRLHSWLEQDAAGLRTMHAVANAAEAWDTGDRLDEDLARGARLEAALEWADGADRSLTAVETEFLAASAEHEASDRRALEERAKTDRRQNRRLRSLLIAAGVLIVALVGASAFAGYNAGEAELRRNDAAIEALVGKALSLRGSERDVAALLAAEAYRRWPDDARTHAGLMGIVSGVGGFLGNAFTEDAGEAVGAVIPGTLTALISSDDGGLAVRELDDASLVRELDLGFRTERQSRLVGVSGDGRVGAVLWGEDTDPETGSAHTGSTASSTLVVVDLDDGRRLLGPLRVDVGVGTSIGVGALALDRTGEVVAIADFDNGSVRLVSVADGTVERIDGERTAAREANTEAGPSATLAFDEDGLVYVGRVDGRLEIVDPTTAEVVRTIAVPPGSAHAAMTIRADGEVLAAGDAAVVAIDPVTGRTRWATALPEGIPGACAWIAVSEPTSAVYCAGMFGRIQGYSLDDGHPTRQLDALLGTVGSITTIDEGAELVTIAVGRGAISRWRLDGGGPVNRLIAPGWIATGGYAFEGSTLLARPRAEAGGDEVRETAMIDTADGSATSLGDAFDGLAWAAGGRLTGWEVARDRPVLIDADTRQVVAGLPRDAYRWWPSLDGRRLYVARDGDWVVGVDASTGEIEGPSFHGFEGRFGVMGVAESPDGREVSITYFPGVTRHTVFDARTGERLATNDLYVTVLLADGGMISFSDNRITRFADIDGDDPVALAGTAGGLGVVSVSSDARLVLVRAADQSASLFEFPRGVRLGEPFPIDSPGLVDAAVRPDGGEMAVTVAEGIMIWDLEPEHQFEAVCRIAGRNLTEQEWRTYLPGFDGPRSTCG
ncbi:BTAD domain-containing putative transcriptional regulator [Agromyces sp. NPDC058126]|uniref:nSTAND1 domain-containing NTPase n=1 Tax=Agromyces sp. NPDC058126 TaxID=3346350 RepID=UPI0036DCA194